MLSRLRTKGKAGVKSCGSLEKEVTTCKEDHTKHIPASKNAIPRACIIYVSKALACKQVNVSQWEAPAQGPQKAEFSPLHCFITVATWVILFTYLPSVFFAINWEHNSSLSNLGCYEG